MLEPLGVTPLPGLGLFFSPAILARERKEGRNRWEERRKRKRKKFTCRLGEANGTDGHTTKRSSAPRRKRRRKAASHSRLSEEHDAVPASSSALSLPPEGGSSLLLSLCVFGAPSGNYWSSQRRQIDERVFFDSLAFFDLDVGVSVDLNLSPTSFLAPHRRRHHVLQGDPGQQRSRHG